MSEEENVNKTIAVTKESVQQLEKEFPALLNFQERLRYCIQYTIKNHETCSQSEKEEIVSMIEQRDDTGDD